MSPGTTEPTGPRGTEKTRLLSALTHELRTPLGSVLMMSELLSENANGNLGQREVRYAENIHQATRDLLELIDQLGEMARIESGRMEVNRRTADPREVVREVAESARAAGDRPEDAPEVAAEVAPEAPEAVTTDPDKLRRLLGLLLESALAVSGGEPVRLRLGSGAGGAAGAAVFEVEDTGTALTDEERSALFVPFAAAGPRSSRRFGGSGLGLPLAAALAELLGGELTAARGGRGCVYRLSLPVG